MADNDDVNYREELTRLRLEHRDLDAAIAALQASPAPDLLQLQRLKGETWELFGEILSGDVGG